MKIKLLELFSGSCSFSNTFKEKGIETITVDNDGDFSPDLTMDICNIDARSIKKYFKGVNIIWASPPCDTYSTGTFGRGNWLSRPGNEHLIPLSPNAKIANKLLYKTMYIIFKIKPLFWFVENPRGLMRKHIIMRNLNRVTVTYCQYGDTRMKPTDLFGNHVHELFFKPMCKNGDPCHEPAPRGAKTGTQGLPKDQRAIVPRELCVDLRDQILKEIKNAY